MGANEPDIDPLGPIDHFDHQAVLVPGNVEDDTIVGKEAGRGEDSLDLRRLPPNGLLGEEIPAAKVEFRIQVERPEIAQFRSGNYVHQE